MIKFAYENVPHLFSTKHLKNGLEDYALKELFVEIVKQHPLQDEDISDIQLALDTANSFYL